MASILEPNNELDPSSLDFEKHFPEYIYLYELVQSLMIRKNGLTPIYNESVEALEHMLRNYTAAVERMRALTKNCLILLIAAAGDQETKTQAEVMKDAIHANLREILRSSKRHHHDDALRTLSKLVELTQLTLSAHPLNKEIQHISHEIAKELNDCEVAVILHSLDDR